tara:strand:- start:6701 stop:6910 length:210 start_codon:yes stop_codon:yes gene_type:complete
MALEDLQSQYGPYNKKGSKGTGEVFDTLANEGTSGLEDGRSKYASKSKNGTKPSGPDVFGNIPAERSYE